MKHGAGGEILSSARREDSLVVTMRAIILTGRNMAKRAPYCRLMPLIPQQRLMFFRRERVIG